MKDQKEKAKELVDRFHDNIYQRYGSYEQAKQCALICVDEIIKANPIIPLQYMLESESLDTAIEFWESVKSEIGKL